MAHDLGDSVDGSVESGRGGWRLLRCVGAVDEEVLATSADSGFGIGEIRGITVDLHDHVAVIIVDGRIRIG